MEIIEVYERVTSGEHGGGEMQLVGGLEQIRDKCIFLVEKYFIHQSEQVLVFGHYKAEYSHMDGKNVFFVYGDVVVPAKRLAEGVYGAKLLPTYPGWVNFYLSVDSLIPISQVLKLQSPPKTSRSKVELELECKLASMLLTNEKACEKLKKKLEESNESEIILRKYLKGYIFEGYRKSKLLDSQGQGVLHLFASLGYTWAISLFRQGGLSVDRKDRLGWTALHWAAFYGRQGAATALLHDGVNPSLLTKATAEHPSGLTAAEIASNHGHNQLATYLKEIVENPQMIVRIAAHSAETAGIKMHGNGGIKD
ncbi:hypothetical protein MKW98_011141 [Papaver atlanticum]|uniref:Uncharacterized protein n=1 Tax=Papaver atlanticum TaxID=357466 RepID=A0AAD4TIT6_9MAGN|nr:hypothetical protein MKW98_011141 [Papaver atlanticum]